MTQKTSHIRRFSSWWFGLSAGRHGLFWLACVITFIALFYAIENWRGKRAWEQCRHELQAKGAVLDWAAYIPPPIPDDQNAYKAPGMREWFVREGPWNGPSIPSVQPVTFSPGMGSEPPSQHSNDLLLAHIKVQPSDASADVGPAKVLRLDDPRAAEAGQQLLLDTLGPSVVGVRGSRLVSRSVDQINPVQIVLRTDTNVTTQTIKSLFVKSLGSKSDALDELWVATAGTREFRVGLRQKVVGADEYLDWTDDCKADFDLMRAAVERPYARIESDYQRPYAFPIPNFVNLRMVAQTLGQRAQCFLLTEQPEAALRELTLVHQLSRMLEGRPTGKPMTLVAAMINVAITGMYVQIVADGLNLHAWREPELVSLEQQLKEIHLLASFVDSCASERAGGCHLLERTSTAELRKVFAFASANASFWEKLQDPRNWLLLAPRGWLYQNMAAMASLGQTQIESIDLSNGVISPRKSELGNQARITFDHFSPYTCLAASALPNYLKAEQTLARNQSLVSEARVACALEQQVLAEGKYAKALNDLVPRFLSSIPSDALGQSFSYHATGERQYVLYSVGWDLRDDGGIPGKTAADGDWTWNR